MYLQKLKVLKLNTVVLLAVAARFILQKLTMLCTQCIFWNFLKCTIARLTVLTI